MSSKIQPKHKLIKNLTQAHSWLGLIISSLLFIVFWAGSVTLFFEEIKQWSTVPHYPVELSAADKPLQQVVENILADYQLDAQERMTVYMPNDHYPYYRLYFNVFDGAENADSEQLRLVINPKTGEVIGQYDQFRLADFLYRLHYDLNLPGGTELVGVVTLFFFFAIVSGIFIQGKKLFKNFFQYRGDNRRKDKLLDMHNVVGVFSLPFTAMLALSGLIFNIAIIYQASFAVFLYQGDQKALLQDAGYTRYTEKPAQQKLDMSSAFVLIEQAKQVPEQGLVRAAFYNYGDSKAALQLTGMDPRYFAQRIETFYRVKNNELISHSDFENYNVLRKGKDVIATLHFGNFAGVDLRILYFMLGIAVCAMIVTGNMMWLDKARRQQQVAEPVIKAVTNLTIGIFGGTVMATAAAFLAERVLPVPMAGRGDYLANTFVAVIFLVSVSVFFASAKKQYIGRLLQLTALLFFMVIGADWWMFAAKLLTLWHSGYGSVLGLQLGMLILALAFLWGGHLLVAKKGQVPPQDASGQEAGKLLS
ncbi:PepSY-associated TM helix domain-containing protein [Thalassomonas haliotis]|uniref:PepSY domain-containing protein n=1 Tax=Thalassomonas haliotis TaxID=485448 RepID=A0ABY7VHR5_9GAMM|nr:PepSY-associated TM helix domain-containing protein [Thalassomonas haliotis]WDE12566.1 PepSY domain-containing protein [Thalassomonas haliotis]